MAQGVPIRYGECHEGPWHKKHMAHHEDVYLVPIDRVTKKPVPGVVRSKAAEAHYRFGEYRWESGRWVWSAPETL